MRCAQCGQENPAGFRFCGACGAALAEAPAPREVRKVVTVVFCDLTGSTELGDRSDPEALRATMRGYYEQMRTILERHGGTVEKFVGDAVMAVFGVPIAHEDDALRAVRAAWEMRAAVPALGLRARIGVNTGEVVAGNGDTLVTGDAVNVAARLEQAADAGQVLIGVETQSLVRNAVRVEPVEVAAKGKPEPVKAFRLVDVDPDAAAIARRLDTPLIGRRAELGQLNQAFERSVHEGRCHLFTLLGPAGVGKSRLVTEFLAGVDAAVLHGRCLDYGEGITFWPVISVLKQLGARAEATLAQLVEGASTANELFWAVRTQLEEVAAERPLVVVFDDIQWGEETFLDLIDHVADLSRGAPILLLCVARPELLDQRPGWGGGKLNATTLLLEPLSPEECTDLIEAHGGVEPETRTRILAAADGNPLFVEEMVALVHEDGDVRVPATVHALLQARLDQLDVDERSVIERGAVEGQIFHRGAVAELAQREVEPQLVGLVRKELIHPTPATFAGDHAFRFRHLLIRDAAYDALPKETRAELHERFADWLERNGHELIELDEVLGYHLEQAARYLAELGRPSAELERRAGSHLLEAGTKAVGRGDAAAVNLLARAMGLLPHDDAAWLRAAVVQLHVLEDTVRYDELHELIDRLTESCERTHRLHAELARALNLVATEPERAVAATASAIEAAVETGDDLLAAQAAYVQGWISWLQSQAVATTAAYEELRRRSARAGVGVLARRPLFLIGGPLIWGPFTPNEIRARMAELAADGLLPAQLEHALRAHIAHREGRFDEAIEVMYQGVELSRQLGIPTSATAGESGVGWFLHSVGRFEDAAEVHARVVGQLSAHASLRSTALIHLAETLYNLGKVEEAERLIAEGMALGADEDVVNFAVAGSLRALIAADRGDQAEAERLAREGLRFAYRTDFPIVHEQSHEALGRILAAAGRGDEARAELASALELCTRYVFAADERRVRALLVEL